MTNDKPQKHLIHVLFEKQGWRLIVSNVQRLTKTIQLDPDIRRWSDKQGNYYAFAKRSVGGWHEVCRAADAATIRKTAENVLTGVDPSVLQSLFLISDSPTEMQSRIADRAKEVEMQSKVGRRSPAKWG